MEFYRLQDGSVVASFTGSIENGEKLIPNTADAAKEKHVPVVTVNGRDVSVKVGEAEHPMTEEHYISFVAVVTRKETLFKEFNPGEHPVAEFTLTEGDEVQAVYEYCTLHGLWKA